MKLLRFVVPVALVAAALLVTATALGGSPKPSVQFKSSTQSVTEAGVDVNIAVTISPKSAPGTVTFSTQGGTATGGPDCSSNQTDYISNTGTTLTFIAGGPTTKYGVVHVCDNNPYEVAETVGLHLSSPVGVTLGSKKDATLTIVDNDPKPTIAIANAADVPEGGTSNFGVTLTGPHQAPVSVHYSTVNGTAVAPGDYASQSGTLTWNAYDNAGQLVSVTTNDDAIDEPDPESYSVQLSSAVNGTIGAGAGTGTANINDNDPAPKFSVNDASALEGNPSVANTLTFTVSLDGPTGSDAKVDWGTIGTGPHGATAGASCGPGVDYISNSGTLTFHPGDPTSQQVTVQTCPDLLLEENEVFGVQLSNPVYASIDDGVGIGTIFNDDGCVYSFTEDAPGSSPTDLPGFSNTSGTVDTISPTGPDNWPYWAGDVGKHVLEEGFPGTTLTFDQLQKSVNVTASVNGTDILTMDAFDAGNNLLYSDSATPSDSVQHQYHVGDGVTANIDHVSIYTTFLGANFAFTDVSFTACPGA